jgi:hypothetical protein
MPLLLVVGVCVCVCVSSDQLTHLMPKYIIVKQRSYSEQVAIVSESNLSFIVS